MRKQITTVDKPWVNRDPQPITFPISSPVRRLSSSFHSDTTVVLLPVVPRRVSSCGGCGAAFDALDRFCGMCGICLS